MGVKLQFQGLTEFREALRRLPEELTDEAGTIVGAHATEAHRQIQQGYPQGPTGNLKRMLTVTKDGSRVSTSAIIRSRAPHASIFEYGTQQRRTSTGANRGRMPKAPQNEAMIPVVIRKRRAMVEALKDLLRRAGFQVD